MMGLGGLVPVAYKGQDGRTYIPQVQAIKWTLDAENLETIITQNKVHLPYILTMCWQL